MTDQLFSKVFEIEELDNFAHYDATLSEPTLPGSGLEYSENEVLVPASQPTERFDYTGVSEFVAEEAENAAQRIRDRIRGSIIETGKDLLEIKEKLGHGKFGPWLKFYFSMSERSAQNFMNAAEVFGATPGIIDVLPPTTVYKLAAKGTPDSVRKSVIDEIAAGLVINHLEVETRITAAKDQNRKQREIERIEKQEASDWHKRERELLKNKASDEDISAERKRWDAGKAQKERNKEKQLKKAAAQVDKERIELEARDQTRKYMESSALLLVAMLKTRLGDKFDSFKRGILDLDFVQFQKALQNE